MARAASSLRFDDLGAKRARERRHHIFDEEEAERYGRGALIASSSQPIFVREATSSRMPRMLTPMEVDSFARKSNPSLLGSRTPSGRMRASFGKNHGKGSQFSLTRRSSLQKRGSGRSSTSSLRRQKSSRQNSLLSYLRPEEPTRQNAEWSTQARPPKTNALWDAVNQGPASSRMQPSLVSPGTSASSTESSQRSGPPSPPTSLCPSADEAKDGLLRRFDLHRGALMRPRTILHPVGGLPRRNTFIPPISQIQEEEWGHFVETADDEPAPARRGDRLYAVRRHPASLGHLATAPAW